MNVRNSLFVSVFFALSLPLAAHADAPSGDFDQTHPASAKSTPAPSLSERTANRGSGEVSVSDMLASGGKTREEVRKELASAPMPKVEA